MCVYLGTGTSLSIVLSIDSREVRLQARTAAAVVLNLNLVQLYIYSLVEQNKTLVVAASLARPGHRKSKFGPRHAIKKLNYCQIRLWSLQTRAGAPRARDA